MNSDFPRNLPLCGFAACLLLVCGSAELSAQNAVDQSKTAPQPESRPAPWQLAPPEMSPTAFAPICPPEAAVPFRDTEYGDFPHCGEPDAPSRGHKHYDYPNRRYGQWYRPKAFGLTQDERCLPRPFRPRGYGNVQNRPTTCYRMDYNAFVLDDPKTKYGPSYFVRQPDGRCGGDEPISIGGDVRWYRSNLRHQLSRVCDCLRSKWSHGEGRRCR